MKRIELDYRPRRDERVLQQEAAGTLVLLCLESGQYYSLDEIGGRIWALCDGGHTAAEIAARLVEEYEAPAETIQDDVLALLTDLANENLVGEHSAPLDHA
mgnify:CR=1 FL=1